MKFMYSAVGDNTAENREWLEKLGYKDNRILYLKKNEYDIIISVFFEDNTCAYMQIDKEELQTWIDSNKYVGIDTINCLGNPQLFQAVTAMREDSDVFQLFTDGKDFIECDREDWLDCIMYRKSFHKATLKELQEHFKSR